MDNLYEPLLKRIKLDDELPDIREITEELLSNDPTNPIYMNNENETNSCKELKWCGQLEWKEKPNNLTQIANATITQFSRNTTLFLSNDSYIFNDSTSKLPDKIYLNLLSIYVLNCFLPYTKEISNSNKFVLNTDSDVFKQTFSKYGGGLISFRINNQNKFLVLVNQDNEFVCREPLNENDFSKKLKEIIQIIYKENTNKLEDDSNTKAIENSINNYNCSSFSIQCNCEVSCPVCLETLNEIKVKGVKLKVFWNCGHVACELCCKKLPTDRSRKINCPQCRIPSNVKQIRVLHL